MIPTSDTEAPTNTPVTFKSLNIDEKVLKALDDMGFEHPTEIQAKAIPIISETKKDFIGQAQTGTGKTAAFVIPLLEKINPFNQDVQALILAPTRELARQVEAEIEKLGRHTDVKSTCIYGGAPYEKQIQAIKKKKPQIVVGTPGRVMDMANRGILKLSKASFCVLDEADEMLNMGFFEDVQKILGMFNEERQLIMFSATMPTAILNLIKKSFNEYELVKTKKKSLSNDNIEQKYFVIRPKFFKEALCRLIDHTPDVYAIIFCKTRMETKEVAEELRERGYSLEVLNGDMGQNERERSMRNFKNKKVTLMVCTDVAARGIDVNNLTHVFNYGLPQDNESYVHRIGRTGRAGTSGKAYTIIGPNMAFAIKKIERHINNTIQLGKLPSVEKLKSKIVANEVAGAKVIFDRIQASGDAYKVDRSYEIFEEEFAKASREELLKLMFSWKFDSSLRQYDKLSDIETTPSAGGGGRDRGGRRRSGRDRDRRRSGGGDRRRSASGSGDRSRRRSSEAGGESSYSPTRKRSASGEGSNDRRSDSRSERSGGSDRNGGFRSRKRSSSNNSGSKSSGGKRRAIR